MIVRLAALAQAVKYIGVKEHPPGTNKGPQIDVWQKRTNGITGYPWCAAFIWCMFDDVGKKLHFTGPALVQNWVLWGKAMGHNVLRPLRGDVVCYDWDAGGWADHIGIVEKVLALRWRKDKFVGWIRAIEGNTSAGNDSNGGQVQRRWRWVNGAQVFLRIPDDA